MSRRLSFLGVVLGLAFAATAAAAKDSSDTFHWSGKLSAGQTVTIRNINGDVRAETGSGDQVEVTAEKSGVNADEVQIKAVTTADGVSICAIYPSDNAGEASCGQHEWHSHNHWSGHARVDFTVRLPRDLHFNAATVNGDIEASELGRSADLTTVNGKVQVSTAEWAEVRTVNGSIYADFRSSGWADSLKLETVNGSVELTAPAALNADVEFNTLNGHVSSDFAYTVTSGTRIGHPGPTRISARFGDGGRELRISTVNGNIEIRKR